jgi:hypothetical protein
MSSFFYGYVETLGFKRFESDFLHYYVIYMLLSHVKKLHNFLPSLWESSGGTDQSEKCPQWDEMNRTCSMQGRNNNVCILERKTKGKRRLVK